MAKILITGAREWSMEDEKTGRPFSGFTVYYKNPMSPGSDGLFVAGYSSGKLSVKMDTPLYHKMRGVDYSKPFEAEPVFDFVPGARHPMLSDIIL